MRRRVKRSILPSPRFLPALVAALSGVAAASLAACGQEHVTPLGTGGGTTASSTTGAGGATGGGGGQGGQGGTAPAPTRQTIQGDVTWTVTFDAAAKTAGATDCAYTRHYEGHEDRSRPWYCPGCVAVFDAKVTMTAGATDCYTQVSMTPAATDEWIGYDAQGKWYRGIGPMSEQGTVATQGATLTTTNQITMLAAPVGGTMQFDVAGTLTTATEDGDPMNGFAAAKTYACGWPKADPPPYSGDYTIKVGAQVPDGLFKDKCGDVVRLHDLQGTYLVVDMSARDCGPCQQMATNEEKFISDMSAQGIQVQVVTLLAPLLADPFGPTTQPMLKSWTQSYMLTSPVLEDRGWGLAMFEPLFKDQTGYPSWVVTSPDLKVLATGNGYDQFMAIKTAILADHGP
jgi:hypothetical protein